MVENEVELPYKLVVESSADAIVTHVKGKIVSANPAAFKLSGARSKNDLIGRSIFNFIHPDSQELAKSRIEKVVKSRKAAPSAEERFVRSDGEILYGEVVTLPVTYRGSPACMSVIRNISRRKKLEENLKESEDRYRKFFETAPYGIAIHDGKTVISANRHALKIMGGKSLKDIVGEPVMGFVHPDYRSDVIRRLRQMAASGKSASPLAEKFIRLDGKAIDVEVTSAPVTYLGKPAFQAVFRDITRQKQLMEELERSEETFRAVFKASPDSITVTDLKTVIIEASDNAAKLFGFAKPEDMVGKSSLELVEPKGLLRARKAIFKTLKEGHLSQEEFKFRRRNGTSFFGEVSGTLIRGAEGQPRWFVAIVRDVTARKEAERGILSAKAQAEQDAVQDEALLESIGDGLVSVDSGGKVIFTNKAIQAMLGKSAQELAGKDFFEALSLVDEKGKKIPESRMPLRIVLETGKPISVGALDTPYYYKPNGELIPVAVTVTPVVMGRETVGAIGVFRDVSEVKQIDRAKTEFVSLASHQLLTPISSMKWYLEMVLSGDTGNISDDTRRYLSTVYQGAKRMGELINALLNVSRIELGTFAIEPSQTDVRALLEDVLDEFEALISHKRIKVSESYKEPRYLNADKNLLRIIFENLLSNSVKYTRAGGSISLSLRKDGENMLFQISDTGLGIPDKDKPQIFTKLFRASNVYDIDPEGTGLGIYTVKSVVEKAGGKIWFESQEGKGTTFFVTIPLKGMTRVAGTRPLIGGSK